MEDSDDIKELRQARSEKFGKLHDFHAEYTVEQLLADLTVYFEGEVDFNMDKLRAEAAKPGVLKQIVESALKNNTHPVSEFLKHIVQSSTQD